MKQSLCIMVMLIVVNIVSLPIQAEDTLPEWFPGYWWSIQTHLDVHLEDSESGDSADMVFDDDAPRYRCQGVETRTLTRGQALSYDVYRLTFSGSLTGSGTADISLTELEIPLELRNGTISGEVWIDVDTLGTVYTSRFITGDLWAYYLFSWQQVGNAEILFNEEYEPVRDLVNFPIEVGNSWTETLTQFTFGRYIINYDLGSGPQNEEDTFENELLLDLTFDVNAIENYKTWDTYRIDAAAVGWDGMILARYSDEVRNMALVKMTDIQLPENGIVIRELSQDLQDFSLVVNDGIQLHLNEKNFSASDSFALTNTINNNGPAINVDQYIILDVYGNYWFWPEWSQEIDYNQRMLAAETMYTGEDIMRFQWPEVHSSATGLKFWGALLTTDSQDLFGDFDFVEWGYD